MLRLLLRLPLLLAVTLSAQTVRWEPAGGTLALNQSSDLTLIFEQCEPKGTVTLPPIPGLDLGSSSRSEQNSFSFINGSATRSMTVSLTYQIRPTTKQPLTIPAFEVATDKGRLQVPSATFEIGEATVGQSNLSLDAVAQSAFTAPPDGAWAGEVFSLRYTLNATRRYFYQLGSDLDWNPAPLAIEPWEKPELLNATRNGEERISVLYKTRAVAKTPGLVTLNPAKQLVNLATGTSVFSVFSRPNLEQFSVSSKPATLLVRPLPTPAPADFTGAVGQFTLDSKIVPSSAAVGEPVTWTLTLAGTGNWPDLSGLPPRSVSKDFRIVQPQAKRTNKDNTLFDASLTEDIVLVPTKPGSYTLGPVTISYFDPKTGTYKTLQTTPVTIEIAPSIAPPQLPTSSAQRSGLDVGSSKLDTGRSAVPPAAIPRDPLASSSTAITPLSSPALLACALASVMCPLFVWLTLALRRAHTTDPRRPQRTAYIHMVASLAALRKTQNPEQILSLLQQWQRDTAILWQLDLAVPTADAFKAVPGTPVVIAETWAFLWAEADRVLYRADARLPEDWIARAQEALSTKHMPGFSVFQLFLPRNLLPGFTAVFLLSAVTLHPSLIAADGSASYAKGDFAAAEAIWTNTLQSAPTTWALHHNLALTLVQQDRWNEASGHAIAAFVQQPQNPAVLWNLEFTLKGAGLHPSEVMPLLKTDPLHSLVRLASPAIWQLLLITAVWLVALSLALWFWLAYNRQDRLKPAAWIFFWLSLVVALFASASLYLYGPLADSNVVFVAKSTTLRSIPTEIDTAQKSSALTPGLIATTDKTFLGWQRLVFPKGQTGWVRRTDIIPLWR